MRKSKSWSWNHVFRFVLIVLSLISALLMLCLFPFYPFECEVDVVNTNAVEVVSKLDTELDTKLDTQLETKLDTQLETKLDAEAVQPFERIAPTAPIAPIAPTAVASYAACENPLQVNLKEANAAVVPLISYLGYDTRSDSEKLNCGLFCDYGLPYGMDRCYWPRSVCAIQIPRTNYGLFVSAPLLANNENPQGTKLEAGKYVVIFGAANAMGVGSSYPLDTRLLEVGIPAVNFARTEAGPITYINGWKAIEPIVVNAAAIIVFAMSGRSAENDSCKYGDCEIQGDRLEGTSRLMIWNQFLRNNSHSHAEYLRQQSLDTQLEEYKTLLHLMDNTKVRIPGLVAPKKIFLWMSEVNPEKGMTSKNGRFPQWYNQPEKIARVHNLAWDSVIDASYDKEKLQKERGEMYPLHPVDKCGNGCKHRQSSGNKTCVLGEFRAEVKEHGDGCTKTCDFVQVPRIYPTEYGHEIAFEKLKSPLKSLLGLDSRPLLILHIGPQKTGSTALQNFAGDHDLELQKEGVYYGGTGIEKNTTFDLHELFLICFQTGTVDECEASWKQFDSFLDEHRVLGHNVFVSSENFALVPEQDAENRFWKYITPILAKWQVRTVMVYRRIYEQLASHYYELHDPNSLGKYRRKHFDSWADDNQYTTTETLRGFAFKHTTAYRDPMNVKARWQERTGNVWVFNYHSERDIVAAFFCQMIPEARNFCEFAKSSSQTLQSKKNPTSGKHLHYDVIAVTAYKQGLVADKSLRRRDVARAVEVQAKKMGWNKLADFPLIRMDRFHEKSLLSSSLLAELELVPEFYHSRQGKDSLLSDFQRYVDSGKLASVDAEKVLLDPEWKNFFKTLNATTPGLNATSPGLNATT